MVKVEIDGMICEKIEEEEEEEEKEPEKFEPCRPDPRFQQQNATKWCYHMFVDFYRPAVTLRRQRDLHFTLAHLPLCGEQNKVKLCNDRNEHWCSHYFGPGNKFCRYFEKCFKTLCPKNWIETWESQLHDGTFPRDITREMG